MSHSKILKLDYRPNSAFGLKTSVEIADRKFVEFIAILLLAPLIWSTSQSTDSVRESSVNSTTALLAEAPQSRPVVENSSARFLIYPPPDPRLSMVVLEHSAKVRGPASVGNSKTIEVIVSAP